MGDPHAAAPCPDFGVGHLQRLTDDGPLRGAGLVEPPDRRVYGAFCATAGSSSASRRIAATASANASSVSRVSVSVGSISSASSTSSGK